MFIYGLGMIDMGSKKTWEILEKNLIENFDKLNKADFDMALAGFCMGSFEKGSMKLRKYFTICTQKNFTDNYAEFIKAANLLGKDRERMVDGALWDQTLEYFEKYLV